MERVENGETIGVENENGDRAVMIPADDELIRIYTDHNEGSWGIVAYRLMPTAYNRVNRVQFPVVLYASLAIWWMQQTHNLPKESSILSGSMSLLDNLNISNLPF